MATDPSASNGEADALPRSHRTLLAISQAAASVKKGGKKQVLKPTSVLLMQWLVELCGEENWTVYPGNRVLADLCCVDRRSVLRARDELEALDVMAIEEREDGREIVVFPEQPPFSQQMLDAYRKVMKKADAKVSEGKTTRRKHVSPKEKTARAQHEGTRQEKKTKGLTDEEKTLLSRFEMMERYLLFGKAGLHETDDSKLKPETMNWRAVTSDSSDMNAKMANWEPAHFVGYYWWLVSQYNRDHGLPIGLPEKGFGRIFREIAEMMRNRTKAQVLNRLFKLYANMDLIQAELKWMSVPVTFNETTLQDNNVMKKLTEIETLGDLELTERWERAGFNFASRNGVPVAREATNVQDSNQAQGQKQAQGTQAAVAHCG